MELVFKCTEVWVKFRSSRNAQRIRFSDGPTTAFTLQVTDDGIRLQVAYLDKDDQIVKFLGFPYGDVAEYCCEEIQTLPLTSTRPGPR